MPHSPMWRVIGHERAVKLLSQALAQGRMAHAYLFVGRAHVGKMTLALNLAQALNCEGEERPCGRCRSCQRIAAGAHADVQVIDRRNDAGKDDAEKDDPRKVIGIAQIRDLQHRANLRSFEGGHRVFVIDGAEHLSQEAANCLLKVLEEPPERVVFVLLATDERSLLPTILSRCLRLDLAPVSAALIEKTLVEEQGTAAEQARVLAHLAQGAIGWAFSAAADPGLVQRRSQQLDDLAELAEVGLERRFAYAGNLASRFTPDHEAVAETLRLWAEWWRDLLLLRGGHPDLVTNVDRLAELERDAEAYSLSDMVAFIRRIWETMRQLEENANPRLALEVLMLDIPVKIETGENITNRAE